MTDYLDARRSADTLELALKGEWRALRLQEIGAELGALDLSGVRELTISSADLVLLDLSSAWRLRAFLTQAEHAGAKVSFRGARPEQLRVLDEALSRDAFRPPPGEPVHAHIEPVTDLGRHVVRAVRDARAGLAFLGQVSLALFRAAGSLQRLRPASVARHVYDTGITRSRSSR